MAELGVDAGNSGTSYRLWPSFATAITSALRSATPTNDAASACPNRIFEAGARLHRHGGHQCQDSSAVPYRSRHHAGCGQRNVERSDSQCKAQHARN